MPPLAKTSKPSQSAPPAKRSPRRFRVDQPHEPHSTPRLEQGNERQDSTAGPLGVDFSQIPIRVQASARLATKPASPQPSGEGLEQEADRVAEEVMRRPRSLPLRVSTPGSEGGDGGEGGFRPGARVGVSQPMAQDASGEGTRELRTGGSPLSPVMRGFYEAELGQDFSQVRVHQGAGATAVADALSAHAFAAGNHVWLGRNTGAETPSRSLTHELVHVAQHQAAGPRGQFGLQREAADDEEGNSAIINRVARALGDGMALASPVPLPATAVAALAAGELGFLHQSYQRLVAEGQLVPVMTRLLPLTMPPGSVMAGGSFVLGFLEGIVSPVVGLYHLFAGLIEASLAAGQWLLQLPERYPALVREGEALMVAFNRVGSEATALATRLQDPTQARDVALAILAASDALEAGIVAASQRAGRQAADGAVREFLTGDLQRIVQTVGLVTGAVTIEVVLLVFTEGIGNLITRIGELARILRPLSRGAEAFAAVAAELGGAITVLEELMGLVLSRTVLRPLRPLLEAVEPLILRLRGFGRALLEAGGERAAQTAARSAERTVAGGGGRTMERAAEQLPAPQPATPRTATPQPATSQPPAPRPAAPRPAAPSQPAPVTRPSPPSQVPPSQVPPRPAQVPPSSTTSGGGGGGPRRPLPGATAEGEGGAFTYAIHPERPAPEVLRGGPSGVRPEASATPQRQRPVPPTRDEPASDVRDVIDEFSEGTASGGRSQSAAEELNVADQELGAELQSPGGPHGFTPREVWEPPPGSPPRPPLDAPFEVRRAWLRERLEMHVDDAIERYRVEGLTENQEAVLPDLPQLQATFRGSRIDEFSKSSIMQDPELAEIITAPDFIPEPDILDSVLPDWFDITTRGEWVRHLRRYVGRYGSEAHHLDTGTIGRGQRR